MGRWAITLLTAMSVLWHTIAGCCAHHAHAAAPGIPPAKVPARSVHNHTGRCGHSHRPGGNRHAAAKHDRGSDGRAPADSHDSCPCHGPDSCDEASCAFALAKPAALPDMSLAAVPFLTVDAAMTTCAADGFGAISSHAGQSEVWWPASLRAHLFLQNLRN